MTPHHRTRAHAYGSKLFAWTLWLFIFLLGVSALLMSPLFDMNRITIDGGELLTEAMVLEQTGIVPGQALFSIDLVQAEQSLLHNPIVAEVKMVRRIPSTLVVRVLERRPVGMVMAADVFWAVDREGVALFSSSTPQRAWPLITLGSPVEVRAGAVSNDERLLAAVEFTGALSASGLANLSEIHADGDDVVAYTRDGVSIALGREGDMPAKARIMESLLRDVEKGRLSVVHIDLRHPGSPAIRH